MKIRDSLESLNSQVYLLIGSETIKDEVIDALAKKHSIILQGNPDFFQKQYEIFTIDDARELKENHEMRPAHSLGKKIFIITTNGMTVEAQNALLKLLEEPAEYAYFFLIIPSAHLLLPTVRSRLSLIDADDDGNNNAGLSTAAEIAENARKFLSANQIKRLDMIKVLVDDISKEKKRKQDALEFVNALQAIIYKDKGVKNEYPTYEVIEKVRGYLDDRAPSVKMLLEFLALSI